MGGAAPLPRVAHTLHLGREQYAHRLAVVVADRAEAADRLRDAAGQLAHSTSAGGARKPAKVPNPNPNLNPNPHPNPSTSPNPSPNPKPTLTLTLTLTLTR